MDLTIPSPLQQLDDERLRRAGVNMYLKRDDLIHRDIPGNKWRKLKYNLAATQEQGHNTLLTFGGAYSNHIRATAAAGFYFGFSTIGIIRGEEHDPLNPSLAQAVKHGMRLTYIDRERYRQKNSAGFVDQLRARFGEFYLLPEGGSNSLALRGCAELVDEIPVEFDVIACASGTGATLAGIAGRLAPQQKALGFSALKGGAFLNEDVHAFQLATDRVTSNWSIETGYHFGGFARRTPVLDGFIQDFQELHGIALEWVYVAKMLYGIFAT